MVSSRLQLALHWEDLSPLLQCVGHLSEASVTCLDSEKKDHILVAILEGEALIVLFHTSSQRQQLHDVA